jgi:glucose/arabinose dehydrogenase
LALELVAEGLTEPIGLEAAPGEPDRLFVVEKGGRIRVIERGVLLPEPFLDLSTVVWNYGESGLLSLAFHPDYARNRRFFVYFVAYVTDGSQLAEFRRDADDHNMADPDMVGGAPLLRLSLAAIHLGGGLNFSPTDGFLYLAAGDRGTDAWAQDLQTLPGKILRLDVSTSPYSAPAGNMRGGRPEIWSYGLRNPWRTSFDPCTGDLFIGDVGQTQREEIDIEPAGQGHKNYGWPIMEGNECHPVTAACDPTGLTPPARDYGHAPHVDWFFVVIGGVVYRGSAIPALRGAYLHSNTGGKLYALRHRSGVVTSAEALPLTYQDAPFSGAIVSLDHDLNGEVYLVDMSPGRIFRLTSRR